VIQCPTTTEDWTAIAEQFEKRWQFPHCCGALDGKHVPYYVVWDRNVITRQRLLFREIEYVVRTLQAFLQF
jgi:hypothetical protein